MIGLEYVYRLLGVLLLAFAFMGVADRSNPKRITTGLFWGLLAFVFLAGDLVPPAAVGGLVIVLAVLVGVGGVSSSKAKPGADHRRHVKAGRLGNSLFVPVLLIPLLTLVGVFGLKLLEAAGHALVEANGATLISLVVACVVSLAVSLRLTRSTPRDAVQEGRRLLDAIGWAALLPLLLATLGGVFEASGVGRAVADVVSGAFPVHIRFVALLAYAAGMALFTMIMGNAFAAFPVMTAGIGLPILVGVHHADPVPMCALGMLSGYCGTLLTPMAANFNLVPAALLELDDPYGVISAQAPTGIAVFAVNLVVMNVLLFR
jgi:uncharacterized membrane protein